MIKYFIKALSITKSTNVLSILGLLMIVSSCEDFVQIPAPRTHLVQENVFENDATALAAMASVYIKLADGESFATGRLSSVTIFEGLYADELNSFTPLSSPTPRQEFYFNNVTPLNGIVSSTWGGCYKAIYECNRILEGLNESGSISSALKNQLSGEALFIRAFCHFYLTNLFGDIPLITTSDYRINTKVARTPSPQVYAGIIADLLKAKNVLSDNYPSAGRVRVNKGTAIALLARAYLYTGDFANAEIQATEIIDKTNQYKLSPDLNTVFLKTSEEAIWQLLPEGGSMNYTNEGSIFILFAPPTNIALRNEVYQSFEAGDLRRTHWIGSVSSSSGNTTWYYAFKYKEGFANASGAEYSMVLRLAEQYLIRAEARAYQNKLTEAQADINTIRNRAGLSNTEAVTEEQLLAAIEHERRMELFTEWGHRFFDLKRTGRLDAVLSSLKPNWNSTDVLLPLPENELLLNTNLQPQNPGY